MEGKEYFIARIHFLNRKSSFLKSKYLLNKKQIELIKNINELIEQSDLNFIAIQDVLNVADEELYQKLIKK
ncbi:MAG: hypothetical protein LKF42_08835 [Streptococcaceae bacterium]|jgi:hypothetical protein|nr:hypothetical protein [Streptococcaceae bacterium]MCH4177271.1 hypothetical protein [Streptococcaceae bacterium]